MTKMRWLTVPFLVVILLFTFIGSASATPLLPSSYYGEVHFDPADNPPAAGSIVEAYVQDVGGVAASTSIFAQGPNLVYRINVPGDDGAANPEGKTVTFKIAGRTIATSTWHTGTNVNLTFHPPQALPGTAYTGNAGAAINFSGNVHDWLASDIPLVTYQWDWENDGTYDVTGQNPSHTWPDVGSYTVGLKVTDAQGGEGTATVGVTVNKRPVTVTAIAASKVIGASEPPLTYTSSDPSATFTGVLVRAPGEGIGTYPITQGTLSAGSNYAITFVPANFTITPKSVTVTAIAGSKVFGDSEPALTYTSSDPAAPFTGALSRLAGENAGTYAITQGTLSAGSNYAITFVPANFTITPKPITVTAIAASKVFGDPDPALTYTSSETGLTFTGALTRAGAENVGTYAITRGNLSAGGNYAITFVPANFTITPKPITVTANPGTKVFAAANPALTYASSDPTASFTGALSRVAGENVGTYAITEGTLSAGSNYTITFVSANFTITPKPITVTANPASKAFSAIDPALTYTSSDPAASFTGALSRDPGEGIGTYAITRGDLSAGGNYTITFVSATFTITPKPITVTANPGTKVFGSANPALTYTSSDPAAPFTGALSRAVGENVGTYAITQGTLSAGSNYAITFVSANFTITPKPITVTANPGTKVFGSANPPLTYSSSETGLTFTGALSRDPGENAGTYAITQGDLSAGSNYAITLVSANFTITPKPITVTANPASKAFGAADPPFTYTPSETGLTFTGALGRDPGEAVGTYAITKGDLSAGSNYTITFVSATFTIYAGHNLSLVTGWNLVSFNVHPLDTSIATVLSSIAGNYDLVYAWDASGANPSSGNWIKYAPAMPPELNTLTHLDESIGFWIHMTAADTLAVVGTAPVTTDLPVWDNVGGWNLVSYPSVASRSLPEVLSNHGVLTDFSLVYGYQAADLADPWKLFDRGGPVWVNDLTEFAPGWGYWIKVSADHTWTVVYAAP